MINFVTLGLKDGMMNSSLSSWHEWGLKKVGSERSGKTKEKLKLQISLKSSFWKNYRIQTEMRPRSITVLQYNLGKIWLN